MPELRFCRAAGRVVCVVSLATGRGAFLCALDLAAPADVGAVCLRLRAGE